MTDIEEPVDLAIIALPVLRGWQFVTLISPVFVYLLITRVSGVPLLEGKADTLPEQAFFLAGTLDDVRANAAKLSK